MLGYKLDPGEPGIPSGAPASQSVLRVLNQELANYMDFKKQAAEQGGFVIGGGIYLDLRRRGSFLAAVAGKTKVFMYLPGNKTGQNAKVPSQEDSGSAQNSTENGTSVDDAKKTEVSRKIDELYNKLAMSSDPYERQQLEQQIVMLTMAMNALVAGMKMPEFLIGMLLNTAV
jgi:hypothetical protein